MHEVVDRLGIEAEHVVFGHIHRRGSLAGDDGARRTRPAGRRNGTTLHNTGNWLYAEALLGRAVAAEPVLAGLDGRRRRRGPAGARRGARRRRPRGPRRAGGHALAP